MYVWSSNHNITLKLSPSMECKDGINNNSSSQEFGGSIPVENVQELASQEMKQIPHRYIQTGSSAVDEVSTDQTKQIPVIDMAELLGSDHHQELAKLHRACKHWGFFQLINHGAGKVIEEMKGVAEGFFKLPLEEKKRCAQLPNSIEGYGQAFVVSEDQKLDWADMLFLLTLPVSARTMRFWPQSPPNFRPTLDNYSKELHKIAISLLPWMATNLGIEPHVLTTPYDGEGCNQGIRMNYYPPCVQADKVVGLTPHSDTTGLTLLVQVNEVQGLQIKKDGKWVPIQPIPGSIIVNIGDIMEIMSNGEYPSIEHRAVVNFDKERLSIAAFHGPSLTTTIGPLPDLVKASDGGDKYKKIRHDEYVRQVIASKLDGKSLLDQLKITH